MKTNAINTNLSEEMIDEIVESQINDDFAWGETIEVTQKHLVLEIPDNLAATARFLAKLDQETDVNKWLITQLQKVLNERIGNQLNQI